MEVKSDPAAAEGHPLQEQPQALFLTVLPTKGDPPAGGHHPVPGKSLSAPQGPDGEARSPRKLGQGRDLAVSDDTPPGHLRDDRLQPTQRRHLS